MSFAAKQVLWFIAFLIVPAGAFAHELLFCQDPVAAVCQQRQLRLQSTEREKRLQAIESQMQKTALFLTARDYIKSESPENFTRAKLDSLRPKKFQKAALEYFFRRMRDQVETYLLENGVQPDLNFEMVRESMKRAVGAQVSDSFTREKILAVIDTVHLIGLSDFLFRAWSENEDHAARFAKECGWDGLTDNAFSDTWSGERVVVACPGAIIGSIEFARAFNLPAQFVSTPLVTTLGHELGHHFDWDSFRPLYQGMKNCFEQNFRPHFNKPVSKYMCEIVADFWGLQILNESLQNLPQQLRERVLVGGLEDLCDSEDDGSHPSGSFRLKFFAGRSASLLQTLGCSDKEQVDCTLSNTIR